MEIYFSVVGVVIFSLSQSLREAVTDKDLYPKTASSPLQNTKRCFPVKQSSKRKKAEEFVLERLF